MHFCKKSSTLGILLVSQDSKQYQWNSTPQIMSATISSTGNLKTPPPSFNGKIFHNWKVWFNLYKNHFFIRISRNNWAIAVFTNKGWAIKVMPHAPNISSYKVSTNSLTTSIHRDKLMSKQIWRKIQEENYCKINSELSPGNNKVNGTLLISRKITKNRTARLGGLWIVSRASEISRQVLKSNPKVTALWFRSLNTPGTPIVWVKVELQNPKSRLH